MSKNTIEELNIIAKKSKNILYSTNVIKIKDEKTEEVVSKQEINEEALAALQVLGYNKKEVEKILEKFDSSKMTVEEIIKAALSYF